MVAQAETETDYLVAGMELSFALGSCELTNQITQAQKGAMARLNFGGKKYFTCPINTMVLIVPCIVMSQIATGVFYFSEKQLTWPPLYQG